MTNLQNNQQQKADSFADPKTAYALAEFLCGQFAKTLIVIFRHDFGERYFNVVDTVGSSATFAGFAVVALILLAEANDGYIVGFFLLGFIAVSISHLFVAGQRDRQGRRWHSRYAGTSYLAFLAPGNVFFVQRYIEPFVALLGGSFLYSINKPLGIWVAFSGICIAITEQLAAQRFRNKFLDTVDAQIEAENLGEAIAGKKDATETEGYILPIPTYYSDERRAELYDGMKKLDPALQAMIDDADAAKKELEPPTPLFYEEESNSPER